MVEQSLELEKVFDSESLYHYHFDLNDLELNRLGLCEANIAGLKELLLNSLANNLAEDLNENFVIEKVRNESKSIPDNTLYVDKFGIDLYSTDVSKVERHKDHLDSLTKDISHLLLALISIENNKELNKEDKVLEQEKVIGNYLKKEKEQEILELEMNKRNKM